jgi:CTP-dependent riboflavin kinase
MPDEINFIDLAALTRITPDAVVEKFGSLINSSFFDASSILATLKQKGMIDFTTAFPGQSAIAITDLGKQLLNDAHDKANTPFDQLDLTILTQLSTGKRNVQELNQSVNVTQKDFALRIYKLAQNAYLSYDIRNGNVSIALTEKGFLQVKSGMPQAAAGTPLTAQQAQQMMQQGFQQIPPQQQAPADAQPASEAAQAPTEINPAELEEKIRASKKMRRNYVIGIVVVVVVIVIVGALTLFKIKI